MDLGLSFYYLRKTQGTSDGVSGKDESCDGVTLLPYGLLY